MTNSRAKGCRGEREVRDLLREAGFEARRGQQFSGGSDSPDVICPSLPEIHIEVKRVQTGNPYNWMEQATKDAGKKIPTVWHKRNGKKWLAILPAEEFLTILRRSDLVAVSPAELTEDEIVRVY